jgi:hypothetical protein
MATDNEQLVLSISADTKQIQRQLKALVGQTERDTRAIESAFGGIDKAASGAFSRVAANGNSAFTTAEQGARRFGTAMNQSRVQTSNLAAQLNDISVQLAGGQSPFLIALQQGSQINQALGSGAGARGAVTALAGAFTSLINPVSLATIGIIALGGTAIQYFTELLSSGEQSEETLKQQAALIQQVADRWGDAVPALREYADELKRAQEAANLKEGIELVKTATLEEVRGEIDTINIELVDLVEKLRMAGAESETIKRIQDAFNEFATAAREGSLSAEQVQSVSLALAASIKDVAIPAVEEYSGKFDSLGSSALDASNKIRQMQKDAALAVQMDPKNWRGNDPKTGRPLPGLSADGEIQNGGFGIVDNVPVPERRPNIELEGLPSDRGSKGGGGRNGAAARAERERQAVVDLIASMETERSLIGATNEERAVANALRRAGAEATVPQLQRIEELATAIDAERAAWEANQEAMREFQQIGKEVLGSFISDIRRGASVSEAFAGILDRLASKLIDSSLDSLFKNVGGGSPGRALLGTHFTLNIRSVK